MGRDGVWLFQLWRAVWSETAVGGEYLGKDLNLGEGVNHGLPLAVLWLRLAFHCRRCRFDPLVRELRAHMPCGAARKKKSISGGAGEEHHRSKEQQMQEL